ncbi:MAG TPA: nuclear transport factor 2 family protein [Pyrinomonadaceae bacterium]|jgi:hypothetical protein
MIGRTQLSVVEHDEEVSARTAQEKIADEAEIRRVVDEIDNACDAKDWAKCRSLFADDVDVDFTSLAGGEPSRMKAGDLVGAWQTNLFAEKKSFHMRSNHRIEIAGSRAEVYSKAYAFNLLESGEVSGLWEVWGEYSHTLERTENGWKVSGMTLNVAHKRGDDRVREFQKPSK